MIDSHVARQVWAERIVIAEMFGAAGLLIVAVFSPWQPLLSGLRDTLGRAGVMISMLTAVQQVLAAAVSPVFTGRRLCRLVRRESIDPHERPRPRSPQGHGIPETS